MALDKNLFTLNIEQSKIEPNAVDLIDPAGTVHYRKRAVPNEAGTYLFSLSDPLSDSLLATAAGLSSTSKEKVIELHNPSATVPLALKGTLTLKWVFDWEQHTFEWKKEACYMVRKPDPPVLVAIAKEPTGKTKTSVVQILDYNLNRFDIEDRKGLEIVLLTSLLTFVDQAEQLRAKPTEASSVTPTPRTPPAGAEAPPPPTPPKPEGWQDQIAILQAKEQREINEVVIGEVGVVNDYVKHCVSLLNDDTLLFITLRSQSPEFVTKVVQVAEATKRTRYKSGGWDEELHQYVSTEDATKQGKGKGPPRVIDLNDRPANNSSKSYEPPASLTIHLSKIAMPELEPRAKKTKQPPNDSSHSRATSESAVQRPGKKSKPRTGSPSGQSSGPRANVNSFASTSSPPVPRPPPVPHSNSRPRSPQSQRPHPLPSFAQPNSQNSRPPYPGGPQPPPRPAQFIPLPIGPPPFPGPGQDPTNARHRNSGYVQPASQPQKPASGSFLSKLTGR